MHSCIKWRDILRIAKGADQSSLIVLPQSNSNRWRRSNDRDTPEQVKGFPRLTAASGRAENRDGIPVERAPRPRGRIPLEGPHRHSPCPCRTFPIPYAPSSGSPHPMDAPSSARDPRHVDDQATGLRARVREPAMATKGPVPRPCLRADDGPPLRRERFGAGSGVEADFREPGRGGPPSGGRDSERPEPDVHAVRRRHRCPAPRPTVSSRRSTRPARRRPAPAPSAPTRPVRMQRLRSRAAQARRPNRPPISSSANSFRNDCGCWKSTIKRRQRSRKRSTPS